MIFSNVLEIRQSEFNDELKVVKSIGIGTYIQSNGVTQSGGIVEAIWRRTIKHMACSIKPNSCLILGLGGGTVAKLIRKKWPDSKITGVEIDPEIVELGKVYLGLDKYKVDIKIQDAIKPVSGNFELVIVDLYAGDIFPEKFESGKFLNSLAKYKIVIFNRLFNETKKADVVKFAENLKKVFKKVEYFYPPANLMLVCRRDNDPEDQVK